MPPKRPRISDDRPNGLTSSSQASSSRHRLDSDARHAAPSAARSNHLSPSRVSPSRSINGGMQRSISKSSQASPEPAHRTAGLPGGARTLMGPPADPNPGSRYPAAGPSPRSPRSSTDTRRFTPPAYRFGMQFPSQMSLRDTADPEGLALRGTTEALGDRDSVPSCVFQCKACRRLLGDTWSFVCTCDDLNYIVLSAATDNVIVKDNLCVVTENTADEGSSYRTLECVCGFELGRQYRTTPRELDALRDTFSIDRDVFDIYRLGECVTQQPPSSQDEGEPSHLPSAPATSGPFPEQAAGPLPPNGRDAKTRVFISQIADRVVAVESALRRTNACVKLIIEQGNVQLSADDQALFLDSQRFNGARDEPSDPE